MRLKILSILLLMAACNSNMLDPNKKEKEDIKNQIENVYFGLVNGAYTNEGLSGTSPENLPFYNTDLSTLMIMGFTPLAMLNGPVSIEPKNIEILNVSDAAAEVKYDVHINEQGKEEQIIPIAMTVKKIGGKWKLDGQKFMPTK